MPELRAACDSKCAGDAMYGQSYLTPHVPDTSVIAAPCSAACTGHLQSPTQDEGQGQSEEKGRDIEQDKKQGQTAESVWGDVGVYVDDVHRAWLTLGAPTCSFATATHRGIHASMRDAVADFVWNVFRASDAGPAGVCLALQLLDRRLATGPPIMNFSILLRAAVACLLLGSKMEDRAPLPADDLYPLTDGGTGTLQDLLSMERDLCRVLRHDFALPTAWHFLTYYCHLTAPGSADLKASAFAALHATSLSGTYASARPQLAAAGSVAWAVCNRGLLQLDKFRKREKRPHDVDALEEPQCKTETVLSRQHRHWRTLVSACGLADTCLAKAYRAVARRVAAQCYLPPGPHVKANSFLRLWLGAKTILQPPVHEAAQRVMDACACHASNALLRQLRKPCFDAGTAVDSYTEDYGNDDQEDYDDDDD